MLARPVFLAVVCRTLPSQVSNSWGKVCSFWFNTAFLGDQRMGYTLFWKKGLDGPFKDKKHKLFPANFSGTDPCCGFGHAAPRFPWV